DAVEELRCLAATAETVEIVIESEHVGEDLRASSEVFERRVGKPVPESCFVSFGLSGQDNDLTGIGYRQRFPDSVYHAENRDIRADSERDDHNNQSSETAIRDEPANGVVEVHDGLNHAPMIIRSRMGREPFLTKREKIRRTALHQSFLATDYT